MNSIKKITTNLIRRFFLIQKVIDTQFFKKDYDDSTLKLLSKPVEYDEAIKSLEKIIESGVFASDDDMSSGKKKDLEM